MRKEQTNQGMQKVFITHFDNIEELVEHCKSTNFAPVFKHKQSSITGTERFTKTRDFDEAINLLQKGWPEGAKQLTKQIKLDEIKNRKEVKRAIYDVVGFQASVPRYLQGIPTNMINKRNVKQKQKVINLYKAVTYSAFVKAETILKDSAKFVQIIKEIEKKGIRVNAYAIFDTKTKDGEQRLFTKIKIKSAREHVNISKLSFPLMHPSFLRRILFRVLELDHRLTNKSWPYGYGIPTNKQEIKKLIDKYDKNGYLIPTLISEEQAASIINESVGAE